MDQPIIYRPSSIPLKKPLDMYERLNNAILDDDKDEFLRLIKDPGFEQEREYFEADTIFQADAIQIAIAVLNGKTSGIIDVENGMEDGWTPLHLAAISCAPRVTKYLIQRGDHVHVDVPCDCGYLNLKQATPVELAVEMIENGLVKGFVGDQRPWTPRRSMFELLEYVCEFERRSLEAVRLLIQNTKNTDRVRKAFFDYADKGKFVQLAALFLAAPELFLSSYFTSLGGGMSSIDMLYLLLNSSEKRTNIEDALSLLLDVFALVGHKLIAYIRVDDPEVWKLSVYHQQFKIAFLLREVAHKKLGISSPDDYLLSFFKPVRQEVYQHMSSNPRVMSDWWLDVQVDRSEWMMLPFPMKKKDIDMDYVNRMIPNLKHEDAAVMNTAIENKLSIMPNMRNLYEGMIGIPKKWEKQRFSFPCVRSFEPSVRFFSTKEATAKRRFDIKVTPTNGWESRVMQPTKLKSFFSAVRLSHFPMIAKRLIK